MKSNDLVNTIKQNGIEVFGIKDLEKCFPEQKTQLKTILNRMIKQGVITRLYRGIYSLKEAGVDIEKVAQRIYYPSYVSFESALVKYGIINQGPFQLTLATTRHGKKIKIGGIVCIFRKIKPAFFTGFALIKGVYMAEAEKAVIDMFYLANMGKITLKTDDWQQIDKLNKKKLAEYAKQGSKSLWKLVRNTLF